MNVEQKFWQFLIVVILEMWYLRLLSGDAPDTRDQSYSYPAKAILFICFIRYFAK